MIGLSDLLAVGLAGFLAGAAYANGARHKGLVECAKARAIVVDGRAYVLTRLVPESGQTTSITITIPAEPEPGV